MSDLRTAAQQALEALEYGQHSLMQISEYQWESRGQVAMDALRAALAQQAEPTVPSDRADSRHPPGCDHCNHPLYAATKCRVCGRVTEQAEPMEPVAWLWKIKAVDTGPHTQQLYFFSGDGKPWSDGWTWTPLSPPSPQRKPLMSDKDRPDQGATYIEGYGYVDTRAVRAVERAHGIKE